MISSVLESCYTCKEWVERRKRKYLVKKELHLLDPTLGLLNAFDELNVEKWREFKSNRNITSATMNVLLEQPGDDYWKEAKQTKSKNKKAEEMSPYAAEFFKVFLERRSNFVKPLSVAHYRPYDISNDVHVDWPRGAWKDNTVEDVRFGVIDFRYTPGVLNKLKCNPTMPYFFAVLKSFQEKKKPLLEEVGTWLFICSDLTEQNQALHYVQSNEVLREYQMDYSDYWPARHERMGDYSPNNSKAVEKVYLTFLQNPNNAVLITPKLAYRAPNTDVFNKPRAYNELRYRINNTELRMEFYLGILKRFCFAGRSVMSLFAGAKFTCAAMVCCFRSSRP